MLFFGALFALKKVLFSALLFFGALFALKKVFFSALSLLCFAPSLLFLCSFSALLCSTPKKKKKNTRLKLCRCCSPDPFFFALSERSKAQRQRKRGLVSNEAGRQGKAGRRLSCCPLFGLLALAQAQGGQLIAAHKGLSIKL